jgi:hypothetical protein
MRNPASPSCCTTHFAIILASSGKISPAGLCWREELPGGIVRLFTFDFEDLLLSTVDISPTRSPAAGVEIHVMKCSKTA